MSIEHNQETMEKYIRELGIDGNDTKKNSRKTCFKE